MRKRGFMICCVLLFLFLLSACGSDSENVISEVRKEYTETKSLKTINTESITIKKLLSETDGPVELTVWTSDEDKALTQTIVDAFLDSFPEQEITIHIGQEAEHTVRGTVLSDVEGAADVYAFVDDQLPALVAGGALAPWRSIICSIPKRPMCHPPSKHPASTVCCTPIP